MVKLSEFEGASTPAAILLFFTEPEAAEELGEDQWEAGVWLAAKWAPWLALWDARVPAVGETMREAHGVGSGVASRLALGIANRNAIGDALGSAPLEYLIPL